MMLEATESRIEYTKKNSSTHSFHLNPKNAPIMCIDPRQEMVETLVHEGSHHATAYTDDVDFEGGKARWEARTSLMGQKSQGPTT